MSNKITSVNRKNSIEAGFTLVELMVSILIFIIFTGTIHGLLSIANIQKKTVGSQTEVTTNLRLSLNAVGRDAANAGLRYSRIGGNIPDNLTNLRMSLPADGNTEQDLLTAVIAGNDVNANNFLPDEEKTDVVSFVYRDVSFNNGNPVRIMNAASLGSGGVVLTTEPGVAAAVNDSATPFDLYLISNEGARTVAAFATGRSGADSLQFSTNTASDILRINAPYAGSPDVRSRLVSCADIPAPAPGEPLSCMNYPNTTPNALVTAVKIFWVGYHITPEGTLMRTTYGNNTDATAAEQIQTQPLAYNIQNFQIRYLLRDGTSSDNPSNNGVNQNIMNSVVQVEVTLTARVEVEENGTRLQKIVDLKSTFSTKNLNYD